jgi:hypothetical protein
MTPFKEEGTHIIFELLYNRKHKQGHCLVLNAFGVKKIILLELLHKLDLHVYFIFNMFTYYCMLHNFIKNENDANIE